MALDDMEKLAEAPAKRRRTRNSASPLAPRLPSRGPAIARFQKLLEATATLLEEHDPLEIGLYQIAKQAGVPPASVYHFFPAREAALQALCQRYIDRLSERLEEPIDAAAITSWQQLQWIDMRRSMEFHNANVPLMKIYYNGFVGHDGRQLDAAFSNRLAAAHYPRLDSIFVMPPITDPTMMYEMEFAIADGIWALSYRRHGEITERYFEESYNAVNAFKRQFLPLKLEARPALVAAAAAGESIRLPLLSPPHASEDQD